ncbi:MAG: DUF72 domain-containing protein [bacterium]|jgi:uncharacterized protein YecE (DUF72 family)|nr:DUF72 domain-containing protein [bacterium]
MQHYHLGCPIWSNKDWVGKLFSADAKQKDFLPQYASVFNTVEGNTTFYGLPTPKTIARWREETPVGFKFSLKFPRAISHDKRLKNADSETDAFLDVLSSLGDRTGPSFLQLPPSFGPSDLPLLASFLGSLPYSFAYAVEVRHPAFFAESEEALNDVLSAHHADRVVFDTRGLHGVQTSDPAVVEAQRKKPKVPVRFVATGPNPFMRFVGHPIVEENLGILAEWVAVVAGWIEEGRTPYLFMHAQDDLYAPHLARHFHTLLSTRIDVGQMPDWPSGQANEQNQMNLF